MRMFIFWDVSRIEDAISHLEDVVTGGAQSANDPGTGGATFLTVNQNKETLRQLYDRWEEKTGKRVQPDRRALTVINVSTRRFV